jgi:hypothetical protein
MKGFLEFLALFSLGRLFDLAKSIVKNYVVRLYANIIDALRNVYLGILAIIGCLILLFGGFFLLHVTLYLYLPWEESEKITLFFVLGLIYTILPLAVLVLSGSRSLWMKASGAKKLLDDTTKKD